MTQTAPKLDADQRIAPRLKTLIAARITFNDGRCSVDCFIRNLSDILAACKVNAPCLCLRSRAWRGYQNADGDEVARVATARVVFDSLSEIRLLPRGRCATVARYWR